MLADLSRANRQRLGLEGCYIGLLGLGLGLHWPVPEA